MATNDDKIPKTVKIIKHLKNGELKRFTFGSSPLTNAIINELSIGPILYLIYNKRKYIYIYINLILYNLYFKLFIHIIKYRLIVFTCNKSNI